MDRQLNNNKNSSDARLKRKLVLHEKGTSWRRRCSYKTQVQTHENYQGQISSSTNHNTKHACFGTHLTPGRHIIVGKHKESIQLSTNMDRQLNNNKNSSEARLKRKLVLHEKGINWRRRSSYKTQVQTGENYHGQISSSTNLNTKHACFGPHLTPGRHIIGENHYVSSQESQACSTAIDHGENHSRNVDDLRGNDNVLGLGSLNTGYNDIGDPLIECEHCGAYMWYQERKKKHIHAASPKYHLCCGGGKIQLPLSKDPPAVLSHLLFDHNFVDSKNFQQNIRTYNMMFAFTSPGAKLDRSLNNGRGPPSFRVHGQACHQIGSLLPTPGNTPRFAQLYIYDTEHEIQNRLAVLRSQDHLQPQIVMKLKSMLDECNVFAKSFRMAKERYEATPMQDLRLKLIFDRATDGRINNIPTVSNVAALIVGDIDTSSNRDIILETQNGQLKRISERHPSYLALQYPLLFPYGEDGYRHDVRHKDRSGSVNAKRNRLTIREFLCFRFQSRKDEAQTILRSRNLFQQFVVDGYCMMESERLFYIKNHQKQLRVDKYNNLNVSHVQSQGQGSHKGKRVVLPSSFVGSRKYMDQLYFDGTTICNSIGFPDLFLTFTCNPNWPEIQRVLNPMHLKAQDRPDIMSRVFKIKLDQLLTDLKKNEIFGKVLAYIYSIEFQKRGLPHAHIVIFLHPTSKCPSPKDIDRIISAEIPNEQQEKGLYELVKTYMMHGPCGSCNIKSSCMKNGKCSRYYPKKFQPSTIVGQDGFSIYKRRDNGITIEKNGIFLDNRHVVPYNPFLLLRYQAHINIEWCNEGASIKYLFKYNKKGYDRITTAIVSTQDGHESHPQDIDEIKQYLDCRYISPCEACWRVFSFPTQGRTPAVERLYFHLPDQQYVLFTDDEDIDSLLTKPTSKESMFTSWMQANKIYPESKNLTYAEFVSKYVYINSQRCWKPRKTGYTIGRLNWVPPYTGELFYLRLMLSVAKGPCTYEDIRSVGDIQYPNFRDACFAMGLLEDDTEYIEAIREANDWGSGQSLRKLFVTMLISNAISRPSHVWKQTWKWLSSGILFPQRKLYGIQDLQLSDLELQNSTLLQIEELLQSKRKSLKDFPSMPYPQGAINVQLENKLIYAERDYDIAHLHNEFQNLRSLLTDEQSGIFETILKAVHDQHGGMFFLYGYGGTGKTFLWKTLASGLRSQGEIVLTVASSGIASLLLPGGRTAHSKFAIPIPTFENSTCNIDQGSELAELLKVAKLIIWDEAPMAHKFCFEAFDKSLRDIMRFSDNANSPFGGKVIVFGGDFRQILPVIPKGSRSDIINATINASFLWEHCHVLKLTKNMRLENDPNNVGTRELGEFSQWILDVGDGKIAEPNDGYASIEIPESFLITDFRDPIEAIVQSTFPSLMHQYKNIEFLQSRAILASTIETVDKINDYVLSLIPSDEKEYLSSDSTDRSEPDQNAAITPEFLNTLTASGLPNHMIKLKIGAPIMLLRNLDHSEGLCNGTRLVVTRLSNYVIEARIMSGNNIGNLTYIPRMSMSLSQSPWPFKLIRRQFPLVVSYAMTINKSQGQSLANVGLYLPKPVFNHGQLYVALSRVQHKKGLKILIHDKDGRPLSTTTNVVFKEVFQNLL